MKIYWIKAQAPLRVLTLAKHLGVDAEFVAIDLKAGELKSSGYAALNPNKKAPTLVDGDLVLWESSAIMAHLCIQAGSDMWPAGNAAEQVEVLRWLAWNDCHWSPAVGPFYFEHIVKTTFKFGTPDSAALKEKLPELTRYADVLEAHLADRAYLACGRLTVVGFSAASMARYWKESEMPFDAYPNIVRWLDALQSIPAWADPWPAKAKAAA